MVTAVSGIFATVGAAFVLFAALLPDSFEAAFWEGVVLFEIEVLVAAICFVKAASGEAAFFSKGLFVVAFLGDFTVDVLAFFDAGCTESPALEVAARFLAAETSGEVADLFALFFVSANLGLFSALTFLVAREVVFFLVVGVAGFFLGADFFPEAAFLLEVVPSFFCFEKVAAPAVGFLFSGVGFFATAFLAAADVFTFVPSFEGVVVFLVTSLVVFLALTLLFLSAASFVALSEFVFLLFVAAAPDFSFTGFADDLGFFSFVGEKYAEMGFSLRLAMVSAQSI